MHAAALPGSLQDGLSSRGPFRAPPFLLRQRDRVVLFFFLFFFVFFFAHCSSVCWWIMLALNSKGIQYLIAFPPLCPCPGPSHQVPPGELLAPPAVSWPAAMPWVGSRPAVLFRSTSRALQGPPSHTGHFLTSFESLVWCHFLIKPSSTGFSKCAACVPRPLVFSHLLASSDTCAFIWWLSVSHIPCKLPGISILPVLLTAVSPICASVS